MFAATSVERSRDGASQNGDKDITRLGSKAKKKARSPEGTLPPLCTESPSFSSGFVAKPLFSRSPILQNVPSDRPLSVVELPRLIAQVGPGRAIGETKWTGGPRLMASALGTDLPIRTAAETSAQSFAEKNEPMKVTICNDRKSNIVKDGKVTRQNTFPLTGIEVVQIFTQKKHLAELKIYYLKEVDGDSDYRPYDLQVVHSTQAGSEHYIFSPNYVLHVTERGYGGLISLAEWYRESRLWTALQKILFFRCFRLRKAFTWWHRNIRKVFFQRRCDYLQDMLLVAVPQFRRALHLFTRVIEDLKETHLLPLEESKTYTLLEFKNVLITKRQECLQTLKKLSQYRTVILNVVKENIYKAHRELQLHMEYAKKPNKCYEPIHLHLAHQQRLKTELAKSENVLQKLGNFAHLINQMTLQSLATVIRDDATYFLNNVWKRRKPQQCCLFDTQLCFSASCQLTVDQPLHLFHEAVSEALLTIGDTMVQMCDSSGFFMEISNNVLSCDFADDVTSDLSEQPMITGESKNSDGITSRRKFCCWRLIRDLSDHQLVLPKQTLLKGLGTMVHGCYYPLSKKQLEWQISVSDVTKHAEKELTKSMQEAELENQLLLESHLWLVDIYLFLNQWTQGLLESMKGQPALLYEEHIKKVRLWAERINAVPSSASTSNQLFITHCTHIKETLGQQLRFIKEKVLEQLADQIKLHSESLISDLEQASAELKIELQDINNLSKCASMVRESVRMLSDMQKLLEYIHSLQDTICTNYRKMTEQEITLEEKMLGLWDCFISLLRKADSIVCHRLPSTTNALDTMYLFLVCDLKNIVSKTTSGPFVDPSQNNKEMVTKLNHICAHVHHLHAKLEQLVRNSQNLQEHTMDLTILTTEIQKVKARKELWELIATYTAWMDEWKQMLFIEVVVSQAQENVSKWKEQAQALTGIIPNHDPVLQEISGNLEGVSRQLAIMAKLQSPTLRHKHWRAILEGIDLLCVPEKVTIAELMSQELEVHQKLIAKICRDAQAECNMEQTFQKLCQGWKDRLFWLEKLTLPDWQHCKPQHALTDTQKQAEAIVSNIQAASQHSNNNGRFTIIGLEIYCADIENDRITLSTMLKSPYSVQFRLQMEDWIQSLKELEQLLYLFERYQRMWAFLIKMFNETFFIVDRMDLLQQFQPADETFKAITQSVLTDPHVLNFINSNKTNDKFHGSSLCQILIDGLSTMEAISSQMVDLLDVLCEQFPRLWFLSDREVIELLSSHPTPLALQPFVCKCFKGIQCLEVNRKINPDISNVKGCMVTPENQRQQNVLGIFGSFQEHITFLSPLEPNLNTLVWLGVFEKQLKLTMVQLMKQCAAARNQLDPSSQDLACDKKVGDILCHIASNSKNAKPVLDLLTEYPLQCLLVAEEAIWCTVIQQAFQESSPVNLSSIKTYNSTKLKNLVRSIREGVTGTKSEYLVSKYTMMCLRALVQLTMNHAQQVAKLMKVQGVLESSFEWLSVMKYHIISEVPSQKGNDDTACYVDVLGHSFQYGFEYFGPEDCVVHTPSTDRAALGILLALTNYRCAFVRGPCMSGKNKTVVQLGKVLGRQVVIVQCCPSMESCIVQKMLLGALNTGALLLLDSVDLLTQGVLSSLSQHLVDIHKSFSDLTRNKDDTPKDQVVEGVTCYTNSADPQCHMVFAGKRFSVNLSYGCILISSKKDTSEVPPSLRFATRPIALTHPDYRIIAEVMLTSIGFSEAMSLSQRLVSLITLAKDSLCLPNFVPDDQYCYLVVLQKIISASEIHLQKSVRQQEISDEVKELAAAQSDLMSSHNVPARAIEKDRKETGMTLRLQRSHLSVIRGLMEETAVVKAILSVLLPVLYEHKKASQFYIIFKDAFPIACQFPLFQQCIEEQEKNQLENAVKEELQRKRLQPHIEIICSALTLYQTMKFSQTVLLIGPSGCGKTTCYRALAGAFNSLAANMVEYVNGHVIKGDSPQAEPHFSATNWSFVDSMVIFPNAMSHKEVFGYLCEKRGWQDGALTRVLTDSERRENVCPEKKTSILKWLILDGEPVGQPGWLDYLTTLCNPEDPFLCLSSGETLVPSRSHLKLIMEVTDLSEASPSAVTRCSLVHVRATDLWKAVWKSEMDAFYSDFLNRLGQGTFKMWNQLAEDLFTSTLSFLRQSSVNSAFHSKGKCYKSHMCGIQEIMSFVRILRALLQYFGKEQVKAEAVKQLHNRGIFLHGTDTPGTDVPSKQEQFARDLFLVAYIWGFGGHLHPCHWPQFDLLVREVLFNCRYKIAVPDKESVFEHFFSINSKMCPKKTLLTTSITPKYGKYTYLLNIMLEANQPVLLAGEPGSGKTTLCQTLLTFDKPHINLPASPLLTSKDLRNVLNNISCQKHCKDNVDAATKQPRLLLFVDDLHEAPCDVFGKTSMALESLRESISKGAILTVDTYSIKSLSSGNLDYMVTCCISGLDSHQNNVISSRLSRLFSIFVLPSLSIDVLLSIHSPRLQVWLKETPLIQRGENMAYCIITATRNLYHAVSDQFQPTGQRPHFLFSQHDLNKVFQGLYLWQPNIPTTGIMQKNEYALSGSAASVFNIVHLWMHECIRTFSDQLCSEEETKTLRSLIAKSATTHFGIKLVEETRSDNSDIPPMLTSLANHTLSIETAEMSKQTGQCPDTLNPPQEPEPPRQSELKKDCTLTEASILSENNLSEEASLKTLQLMEDIMAQLVYGPDILESLNSLDRQKKFKCSSSYNKQDLDGLLQKLSGLEDREEEGSGHEHKNNYNVKSRYFVNRQRVSQLLHILRALLIPGGHGVLIGIDKGTGRKTTVRLAAHLTGYQLMEVHSGNENEINEILKEAGNQTRVNGGNVIILVHEEISQSVREEILVAMAHRTYPALCTEGELRNLISRVTAVNNSRQYLMDSWAFERYLSQVHRNVHVFLLMSHTMSDNSEILPNNGTSCWNRQMSKAMSLSCCVEVYKPWSNQSLMEVAAQCLKTSSHKMEREGSEASLSVAMAGIHQSACRYASVHLKAQPFSPHTYMEFFAHFGYLCNHLYKQWQDQATRVASVLTHLDVMNTTAENYKQNFKKLQEKVAETQQQEQELIRTIDNQKSLIEEAEEKCVIEEKKLHHLEEQINKAQIEEKPIFLAGLKILKCLNPSDLEEVRHYRDPPDGVVKIMDAICLLFNRPPGWESTKQLLGQSNFFQELEFFDRYSVTNEQLQQLGQIVQSPQFVPESVRDVSKACESLCRWVQALYECCCMQHQLSVKQQLEVLARAVRGQSHLARQHKENACCCLDDIELQLQFIQNDLEEQMLELYKYESLKEEATAVAEQVKAHVSHWKAAAKEADLNKQNIPGDALILAAVIAYLGPFSADIRIELLSKWRELCQTGHININPKDPRTFLFKHPDPAPSYPSLGFTLSVSERLQQLLGRTLGLNDQQLQDTPSARLLVQLLLWGNRSVCDQHWPLLADTQQHNELGCQSWLTTGEYAKLETQYEMELSADDPELVGKLDQAAEEGLKVLVTHVEHLTPSSQFLARLVRPVKKQHVQPSHPEFCLFLSTHLPVRLLANEIHPSILAQVHVVDLSLSSDEIQELMLTQLLQSECKELLIQHLRFQNEKHLLQEKLIKEQDSLADYILQSNTSLLLESDFLPCMAVRQEAIKKLQTEIQQLSEELEYHEVQVAAPRRLVRLAAALYQALQDVSCLSPAYYFSLQGFMAIMQEAFILKGRPLVPHTLGKVLGDIVPEITNRMVAQLLSKYRPCLFKSHVAVLKLLVSLALLQYNELCSEGERVAFIRGLQDVDHPTTSVGSCTSSQTASQSTSSLPSWIPAHIHKELLCLEEIPCFRGLIASLSTIPIQWQEYLHFPSSTVTGAVPCRSHSHLSLLQRALLWKTMVPNCLEGLAEAIATCQFCVCGQTAQFPHTGDPEALSHYIKKYERPIILTLPSPRGDTWTSIHPLYLINKMAHCLEQTKKVQVNVIFLGALCEREVILSAVDKAVTNGHWLVFSDCHLLEQWDKKVVTHLSQLISSFKDERHLVHPCFRLWFITQEHASYSIPAALRVCALPLVCDSPLGLKEELNCSLRQVASIIQRQPLLGVTADNMELLVCCVIFHSVLLQRQSYKYLGQGRIYSWSQEDLQTLVDAHKCIASLCHSKTKALQYIAVNLVHGGNVLDSGDLEVVESVAKTFLGRLSPLWGSGAKILSNFISNPDQFDLSGLLQFLGQGPPNSEDISDPLMLGFSADVAAEIIEINSHNLNVLLQASQTPPGTLRHIYAQHNKPRILPPYDHARDRLVALKSYLTAASLTSTVRNAGVGPHSLLRDFLQDEWDDLTDLVSMLLIQLQQPVQYSTLTFDSLLKLNDLSRLERRAELLSAYLWHHNISDPPGAYRLSAFKNGRGFLVAMIREAAQVNHKYISDIELHFQVLSDSTFPSSLPLDDVYLCGLELRGASWDTQLRALQDTVLLQPCLMPLVCLKTQVRSKNITQDSCPCKSSYVTDNSNVQLSDGSLSFAPQLPVYYCPLYLDEEWETGDSGLADSNIITKIPLHARLNLELCSLRRVRLVSTL